MGVVPFQKTGSAPEGSAWEWNAAVGNAILDANGHEEQHDNWALYEDAHTWVDTSDGSTPSVKSAYKLPHHRLAADGKTLTAVWAGVVNAMARLKQTDLPEADMKGAFDHLAKHYAQWGKTPPDWGRFYTQVQVRQQLQTSAREHAAHVLAQARYGGKATTQPHGAHGNKPPLGLANRFPVMTTRADILSGGLGAVADGTSALPGGTPTDAMLSLINLHARTPQKASDVYVFPTQVSNQNLDSFWTRMTPLSLHWFAEDATRGVAICDSHVHDRLPIGRSFFGVVDSQVEGGPDGGTLVTMTTQTLGYLVRGLQLSNGMSSDDVARGIEAGLYWQASIGFDPVAFHCSVCGRNMLTDPECFHIPGFLYPVVDADARGVVPSLPPAVGPGSGRDGYDTSANYGAENDEWCPPVGMCASAEDALYPPTGTVACIADVDAHLIEYSLVFRHATPDAEVPSGPNAMLLKAEAEAERGRATPRLLMAVEDRCHTRLFDRWSGFGPGQWHSEWHSGTQNAHVAAPSAPTDDEGDEEEMRGSEYVMVAAQDHFARAGRELSAQNLADLREMTARLQAGHDTLHEGIGMLNAWLLEKGGTSAASESQGDNADLAAQNAGTAENAAAMAESTASGETGANGQQTLDAIAASQAAGVGSAGPRAQGSADANVRADAKAAKAKVSAEDQAVDKALDAVEAAMKGLQIAQAADEKSEGETISPEDAAVDAAIKAAYTAINKIKKAQAADEASDPDSDSDDSDEDESERAAKTSRKPRRASQNEDEAADSDAEDSTDEDEGALPVDPDDPDSEEDPDEENPVAGEEDEEDEDNRAAAPSLDFDSHKAMTGKHQHGKFGMHAHNGDADHSDAPLEAGAEDEDGADEDDSEDSERVDTGVDAEDAGAHDMGGDPTRERAQGQQRARHQSANAAKPVTLSRADREALEYGRQMRARLVDDALAAGVRAFGPAFNPESYRAILANSTAAQVQSLKDDWDRAAGVALSPIGQFTPDAMAAGGGYWDATPAANGIGGRQTVARDPGDPVGVYAAGARTQRGGANSGLPGPARPEPRAQMVRPRDVSLFQVRAGNGRVNGRGTGNTSGKRGGTSKQR